MSNKLFRINVFDLTGIGVYNNLYFRNTTLQGNKKSTGNFHKITDYNYRHSIWMFWVHN